MKYKRFRLSEVLFIQLFKSGDIHIRVINGLPDDTKFVRWYQSQGWIEVVIESESFELLNRGDVIPEIISPMFDKL